MATVILPQSGRNAAFQDTLDDRHGWGLMLLLAAVATLFLRPTDLIPSFGDWPIYQSLIVGCLVVSARPVFRQLAQHQLSSQPVTACLLVLLLAVCLSHLSHGLVWESRMSMYEVIKLVALYLLIVGLINTPRRLLMFVQCLSLVITAVALLALLDHFGMISVAALAPIEDHAHIATGEVSLIHRIRGTGIFQDPNDFGLILVTGLVFSASSFMKPVVGWLRYVWLAPTFILMGTLALTHSRGAWLSLLFAIPAAFAYRRGWKFGLVSLVVMPVLAVFFSARMTDIHAITEGTGQSRLQIWSESMAIWRQYPIFGLGEGLLVEELGVVTHNSFLQCFAELGVIGGSAFLSTFLAALWGLWILRNQHWKLDRLGQTPRELYELAHLRMFIFSAAMAYAVGILTLSRQFVAPTYLILGLATAAQMVVPFEGLRLRINNRFLFFSAVSSCSALLVFHLAIRLLVHW